MNTPEAIRDSLREVMSGFLSQVMYAIDPALEANQATLSEEVQTDQDRAGDLEEPEDDRDMEEGRHNDNTLPHEDPEVQRAEQDLHSILHGPVEEHAAHQDIEGGRRVSVYLHRGGDSRGYRQFSTTCTSSPATARTQKRQEG